jgi:hypothetical protein
MRYHDYNLEGYSVRQNGAQITLHLVYDYSGAPKDWSHIEFSDVLVYNFTHTGSAIITEIYEVQLAPLVNEKKEDLAGWWKNHGGLGLWNDDAKIYGAKLESERYRAWRIDSAIGFEGFIIGKRIKQTEPNQAPQTTTMAVTDAAAQPPRQP